MSVFDKIKDAFGGDKDKAKDAAQQTADQLKEAADKLQAEQAATQARDEAEAREAADREAEAAAEAARQAKIDADAAVQAETAAAELRAQEEARAAEAAAAQAAAKPTLSVGRVREVVAHDSSPSTPTGQGMDKELGMLLETALRRALDQAGLPNRNTDDGSLGTMFLESYSRWQGHLGYSGSDADGVPGRATLAKLAEATGMFDIVD
ncbi:MAG: hypothetical protein Q4G46_10865 [Propionibacteriaceae bacterium]|nr:hypothetical protein [Propionibacteriaceae bacterium]